MNFIFSNPGFLYFIPLTAIPFILHLISRDLPTKIFFPAIRFIKVGKIPVNEKRKLRDILLMLVRMLIILAIILIFADPSIKKEDSNHHEKVVVIFDTSIVAFHQTYLDKIKDKLSQANVSADQEAFFIESSNHIKATAASKDMNLSAFAQQLKPSYESPNHYDAFTEAAEFLDHQKGSIVIFSNFDIHGFEQINKQLLHPKTNIKFIDISLNPQNKSIVSALATTQKTNNKTIRVSVKIKNDQHTDDKTIVQIFSNQLIQEKEISIKQGETDVVIFSIEAEPGTPLMVSISNDDFAPDNTYYLRSPNLSTIDTLLISNPNDPIETLFFSEALSVTSDSQTQKINLMKETPKTLFLDNYETLDFIIISGCAFQLNDRQLTNIFKRYKAGTHLLLTPGKAFRKNLSKLNEYGLIAQTPLKKVGDQYQVTPYFISSINSESPWLKLFKKNANDFLSIPVKQYIKLRSSQSTQVLLTLEKNDPFLVMNRQNNGISFLFSINLTPSWSDLPITPIFLPLLHQLITVSYSNTHKSHVKKMSPGGSYKPTKNEELIAYRNLSTHTINSQQKTFIKLDQPGCYYNLNNTLNVNASRDHVNPDKLSIFEFNSTIKRQKALRSIQEAQGTTNNMWANLCYLLLFLLAIETLLHGVKPRIDMHTNITEN